MFAVILSCMKDETGVTAIEYGLIASVIIGAIAGVVSTIGASINTSFTQIAGVL